jgi:isopentenyl phosphate kinase
MIVLKLGGSVITEKDREETLDGEALERAAAAVADCDEDLVVVHGGGSFGHPHAEEWGASTTDGVDDVAGITAIHTAMTTLNAFVLRDLHDEDVPAVPVHPFSAGHRDASGDLSLPSEQVETLVDEGFVPVLHGDLVAHAGKGATVLSGDEIVTALADSLDADRVGVCSTVPGVLDADGETVLAEISAFEDVADALGGSDATDVSGGMAGKVRALLALGSPASVFSLEDLSAFLDGEEPGTTIHGDS